MALNNPEDQTMPETPAKRVRPSRAAVSNSRSINLRSGGTLTLTGNFNALDLTVEDLQFITGLAKVMTEYQTQQAARAPQAVTRPVQGSTN